MPYIVSGGIAGLFLIAIAGVLWLSADLRDEWIKLDELDETLTRIEARLDQEAVEKPQPTAPRTSRSRAKT